MFHSHTVPNELQVGNPSIGSRRGVGQVAVVGKLHVGPVATDVALAHHPAVLQREVDPVDGTSMVDGCRDDVQWEEVVHVELGDGPAEENVGQARPVIERLQVVFNVLITLEFTLPRITRFLKNVEFQARNRQKLIYG